MAFFKHVEGESAVIVTSGIYKQVDVYMRNGALYAKDGGGFIRLYADGATTKARTRLETISWEGTLFKDRLGRLYGEAVEGGRPLQPPQAIQLIARVREAAE